MVDRDGAALTAGDVVVKLGPRSARRALWRIEGEERYREGYSDARTLAVVVTICDLAGNAVPRSRVTCDPGWLRLATADERTAAGVT